MKRKLILLLITVFSVNGYINAQYGTDPPKGDVYEKMPIFAPPPQKPIQITNTYWDGDKCIYPVLLDGPSTNWVWDLSGSSIVKYRNFSESSKSTHVEYYILHSDWVSMGKPYKYSFGIYNKVTGTFRIVEMRITGNDHSGGRIDESNKVE